MKFRHYPGDSFRTAVLVSQAPPGRAKCPADPHARRRPKREAEGREPAAAGHGDRGAKLAGAAVSPPGPQRIIAQMLRACGIQVQVQVIIHNNNILCDLKSYEDTSPS
jgi:hypothetical protein